MEKNPDKKFLFFLGIITLIGFALRLHGLWSESFTADELDTVFRIKSSRSIHELLYVWVRSDGHPPFTHLLEYFWTKIFGFSEGAIRFPFALMGAGAIWFAGRTAKLWFNSGAAIAVAACLAFLQFPLMYSQLARPYAPGIFFSMMFVWYWSKFLFLDKKKKSDLVWFALAAVGAIYSHYFSLLLAGLIGISGLFFLRRDTWKSYFIACGTILLLFLPYTGIFIYQLGVGGVGGPGGWLGKPSPSFVTDHIWFIFDESRPIVIMAFLFSIISAIVCRSRLTKFHLLAFFLWITPLLIGYFYSQKSPVLQNSVLLFSFPFLMMFLFSWIPPLEKRKWTFAVSGLFAIVLLSYSTIYKPFHLTDHFGRLKEISTSTIDWGKKFGEKNISCAYNVDFPFFMEYYWEKCNHTPSNIVMYSNTGFNELNKFRKSVADAKGDYFVYGWSTKFSPPEIIPIIREKFPYLIEKKEWFNSAVYLFSKNVNEKVSDEKNEILFYSKDTFYSPGIFMPADSIFKPVADWSVPCKLVSGDTMKPFVRRVLRGGSWKNFIYQQNYVQLDSTCVYSPLLKKKVGDILYNPDNEILFTVKIQKLDTNSDVVLVIEFFRDEKQLLWNGMESASQIEAGSSHNWQNVYFGLRLPKDLRTTDTVHFYCYSKNGVPVLIDNLEIKILKGHRGIYGPRSDLK